MVNGKQVTFDYLTHLTDELRIKKVYMCKVYTSSTSLDCYITVYMMCMCGFVCRFTRYQIRSQPSQLWKTQ